MYNRIAIVFCLIFSVTNNKSFAQDKLSEALIGDSKYDTRAYQIQSLDGKNQTVHIMPIYEKHVLKISCLNDTLIDDDFWDVPPITEVLNKNFIEIRYEVRGGSGLGLGNILLLCVNGNKLFEAMHVLRYLSSEGGGEKTNYNLKLTLNGNNKRNFKLIVDIHDRDWSRYSPEINYDYRNRSILSFDVHQNIFFSLKEGNYNSAIIDDKKPKQQVKGVFPVIILGKENYYFIGGNWYNLENGNEFYKYSFNRIK